MKIDTIVIVFIFSFLLMGLAAIAVSAALAIMIVFKLSINYALPIVGLILIAINFYIRFFMRKRIINFIKSKLEI